MSGQIIVGKIGAPHGVRGEVRIVPLTDFPDRFKKLKKIFLDEKQTLEIERVQYSGAWILMKFRGVDDRDAAERLKGRLLKVGRDEVPPLAAGEYYSFDIIGLDVYDEKECLLGRITEILKTGSNDVYVTELDGKKRLIPALKKVVTEIDLATGRMQVLLPEEME